MEKIKLILVNGLFLCLTSCLGFATYDESLVGNYTLNAIDTKSGMTIFGLEGKYRVGAIGPTVFAVGFDEEFIIAKQHPAKMDNIDRTITNFYIIPIQNKISESVVKNVFGPMTKTEFDSKRDEIGVSKSLAFSIEFEDLL